MEKPHENILQFGRPDRSPQPEDVRLASGSPLYYALLEDREGVERGTISSEDSQQAHARLRDLFAANPERVLACQGKTDEEATEVLNAISSDIDTRQAA
ncbi:MAG: hypothetical protein QOE22_158 [Candidatus Parcubacteria bacterium]|jgi:hypothetical protein|nr:hypothetical protein [Candidatus Parcubacteria bacterium]